MPLPQAPLFLGWDQPWLPQLAVHFIERFKNQVLPNTVDLSQIVVILPGRRATRRLLELLALEAQEQSLLLLPPLILTLEEAIMRFLEIPEGLPAAPKSITQLAWHEASVQLSLGELEAIHPSPHGTLLALEKESRHRVAILGQTLALELGTVGLSLETAFDRYTPFFPESADREEPRWQALIHMERAYHKILTRWGYSDPSTLLKKKLEQGDPLGPQKFFVVGVADFPSFFTPFFEKVSPELILIASEAHAKGFDPYGKIIPSYWLEHPAVIPTENILPCERSRDQAAQTWEMVTLWKKTIPEAAIKVVVPELESLPLLREKGSALGFQTRWAGGRLFRGSSLFILLTSLEKFLHRAPGEPPSLAAVAALLRHPLIAAKLNTSLSISPDLLIRELDQWERDHLALVLEEEHLKQFHKEATLGALLQELEQRFSFSLEPRPLQEVLSQCRQLLFYLLGEKSVQRTDPEEHFFLKGFEKLLLLLDELEQLATSTNLYWRSETLLTFLLEQLGKEALPELEHSCAIEMIGWLEAHSEDVPGLILTSFHEGAIPSAPKNDPLLPERVRKKLGLNGSEEALARDHYYLHLILASRKKEGGVAIIAPRYNGRHEPVRPSRLLLQGCSEQVLPSRILALTQRQRGTILPLQTLPQQSSSALLQAHLQKPLLIEQVTITSLRTYLRSPRLFYFQHILKLQEVLEAPTEMTPAQFGVLLHRILSSFSSEAALQETSEEALFTSWLQGALDQAFYRQFGRNPAAAVASQKKELLRALQGFARAEARHRAQGWKTIAVEGKAGSSSLLEEKIILEDQRSLLLQGRIDRLDWHPEKKRWLLLDYKTSHHQEWKKETPNHRHFHRRDDTLVWHDLQLPLYLKLAPQFEAVQKSGLPPPTIENTDLCFFQLPIHPDATAISEPFDATMIEPAWKEAQRIMTLILDGHFADVGTLSENLSPTWSALCKIPLQVTALDTP